MAFDGINDGVAAGKIIGDVVTGGKTEIYYSFGGGSGQVSGEIPQETMDRLAEGFVSLDTGFDSLLARLRAERVLVLAGDPSTGRRTAGLMLLHRLGITPVHALDRTTNPDDILPKENCGHVLLDLKTSRTQPLREAQVLALRGRLRDKDSYLVITTGHSPYIEDTIQVARWTPPAEEEVLSAHLRARTDETTAARLLALPNVAEFLTREHQLREVARYATVLVREDGDEIEEYSLLALKRQIQEWFEESENTFHLREKAFLIALAVFDNGPYPLTAELSDALYERLRRTGNDDFQERIPVFGTHIGKRLQTARARPRPAEEVTEWGPVRQLNAEFKDDRTALLLLSEVWTGHPAARPALIRWLTDLATDGRPFVRTRAAAAVAVLARNDLPSAMALIVESWADDGNTTRRTTAVSALTFAHRISVPNIPRIIDGWSAGDTNARRCWVAIRVHGLIGSERPEETLAMLRAQARHQHDKTKPDQQIVDELPESVALLILSPARERTLSDLLRTLDDHPAIRKLTLDGFLAACTRHTEDTTPPILEAFTYSPEAAPHIARLLRTALGDRAYTQHAEERVLRPWIRAADRDTVTEQALASLLTALAVSPRETARLAHLLATVDGGDGRPRPPVAHRLRTALPGTREEIRA
ncbi:hypothetical protein [Streptomyces sp. NPDC051546]|uniref:hypothetical protein n=1 Tax=Streptomyces sp. NPDC051546 TaxID=3365655 RepID=UPI00379336D4